MEMSLYWQPRGIPFISIRSALWQIYPPLSWYMYPWLIISEIPRENCGGDGRENIGYLYWTDGTEVVDVWKNGMEVPDGSVIKYNKNFHWKNHVKNYGLENAIYSVEMLDKDGSFIKFAITYDSRLFSYAK